MRSRGARPPQAGRARRRRPRCRGAEDHSCCAPLLSRALLPGRENLRHKICVLPGMCTVLNASGASAEPDTRSVDGAFATVKPVATHTHNGSVSVGIATILFPPVRYMQRGKLACNPGSFDLPCGMLPWCSAAKRLQTVLSAAGIAAQLHAIDGTALLKRLRLQMCTSETLASQDCAGLEWIAPTPALLDAVSGHVRRRLDACVRRQPSCASHWLPAARFAKLLIRLGGTLLKWQLMSLAKHDLVLFSDSACKGSELASLTLNPRPSAFIRQVSTFNSRACSGREPLARAAAAQRGCRRGGACRVGSLAAIRAAQFKHPDGGKPRLVVTHQCWTFTAAAVPSHLP